MLKFVTNIVFLLQIKFPRYGALGFDQYYSKNLITFANN